MKHRRDRGLQTTPARLLATLQEGIALHNGGRLDEADALYREVLRQAPRHADALHLRALVCHARGNFSEATQLAEAAIAVAPRLANFHNTAGEAWRRLGQSGQARKRLTEAIRLDPSMAMAHHNLSMVCWAEGSQQEAWQLSQRALQLNPGYAEALIYGLSIACELDQAASAAELAARLEKLAGHPSARAALAMYHCYRARTHFRHLEFVEGDQAASTAIAIDPEFWGGWGLRGEAFYQQGDFAQAELFCSIAVSLAPQNQDARGNLALLLKNQKRLGEAASHLRSLLGDHPDNVEARFNLGTVALMQGDYAAGWPDYEARWAVATHRQPRFAGAAPWQGQPLDRLLLYAEQGLGDTVQMLRFLPEAALRCGGQVVLQVPAALLRITRRMFESDRVSVVADVPESHFDAACPLMSLPLVLGANSPERIRGVFPYLAADPGRVEEFSTLLAAHPGRKLGLVWRGREGSDANRLRILSERDLAPLVSLPGWTPVSLQFGLREPEIASRRLVDLSGEIADFEDLAAAMMAVDAVVSLDTGPAHLAGALGLAVHTLLPWLHDWRWGAAGDRCDWYPAMELLRQPLGGSWQGPVARLAERLGGDPAQPDWAEAHNDPQIILSNIFPLLRAACRHGNFRLPLFDPSVTRSMLAYGEYLPRQAEALAAFLQPGDTVVEVGAKLGSLTLPMARAVAASGRVIAIEAHSLFHECLLGTIADSAVPWVEARFQAAGSAPGTTRIRRIDPTRAAGFGGTGSSADGIADEVEVICLDSLDLKACRLIRIDAEGGELAVLQGATGLIGGFLPVLCIECESAIPHESLTAFLKRFGYRTFTLQSPLFAAQNYRNCAVSLFPGRVSRTLFGLPPGVSPLADMQAAPN